MVGSSAQGHTACDGVWGPEPPQGGRAQQADFGFLWGSAFSKLTASRNHFPGARGGACPLAQQVATLRAPPSFLWL